MKDRIKWMLVGLGFTFGLQVIISLIFTGIAFSAARSQSGVPENQFVVAVFGLTLVITGVAAFWESTLFVNAFSKFAPVTGSGLTLN